MEVVRAHFRPEFLNRLDEIILFHRLALEHMGADRRHPARAPEAAEGPQDHARADRGARAWLWPGSAMIPVYGAAAEARVQKYLQDPLADAILSTLVELRCRHRSEMSVPCGSESVVRAFQVHFGAGGSHDTL
jgi:ATP-dependent Clp protease ATP-binding subunit ClpA